MEEAERSTRSSRGRARSARPTIFDIARAAGVSSSTVSRVINGLPHIRPETQARVETAMRDLGYVAHLPARALATGRSNQIGLLVQQVEDAFFLGVIAGVDRALMAADYDLLLCTTHDRPERESSYVARLAHGVVDGLLILMPRSLPDYMDWLRAARVPFVVIDHDAESLRCDVVNAANRDGTCTAMDYLLALGHTRIAIITGALETGSSHQRISGWRASLGAAGLPAPEALLIHGDFKEERGREATHRLLALSDPPTAIFASNDRAAFGVLRAAAERGVRVPDDLSVLGFDDEPMAAWSTPGLTTVHQPLHEMGTAGVNQLLARMRGSDSPPQRIVLDTELVIRGTTGPAPRR